MIKLNASDAEFVYGGVQAEQEVDNVEARRKTSLPKTIGYILSMAALFIINEQYNLV